MESISIYLTSLLFMLASYFGIAVDDMRTSEYGSYASSTTAEVVRVIDGDTIDVSIAGVTERVRYIGIDSPELSHGETTAPDECFAEEATAMNRSLVAHQRVTLVFDLELRDTYDRLLSYVYVGDMFVNEELLATGGARTLAIPPNITYWKEFKELEQEAKNAGVGLWQECAT